MGDGAGRERGGVVGVPEYTAGGLAGRMSGLDGAASYEEVPVSAARCRY